MGNINYNDFAQKIKAKYPEYANVDNKTLATKMVEKYPEYSTQVTFDEPNIAVNSKLPDEYNMMLPIEEQQRVTEAQKAKTILPDNRPYPERTNKLSIQQDENGMFTHLGVKQEHVLTPEDKQKLQIDTTVQDYSKQFDKPVSVKLKKYDNPTDYANVIITENYEKELKSLEERQKQIDSDNIGKGLVRGASGFVKGAGIGEGEQLLSKNTNDNILVGWLGDILGIDFIKNKTYEYSLQNEQSISELRQKYSDLKNGMLGTTSETIGMFLPAIASTVLGAVTGQPELAETGISSMFAADLYGTGIKQAEDYEKQTGTPISESQKQMMGLGYGVVGSLLGKGISGLGKLAIPTNASEGIVGKVFSKYLANNPQLAENIGKTSIETFAKQSPNKIASVAKQLGVNAAKSVGMMEAFTGANMAVDKAVIGKTPTLEEAGKAVLDSFKTGLLTSGMFAAFTIRQPFAIEQARKARGQVTLTTTSKGLAVEVLNNETGLTPEGKTIKLVPDDLRNAQTYTYDDFKKYTSKDAVYPEKQQLDRETFSNNLTQQLSKIGDKETGTINVSTDSEGNKYFGIFRDKDNKLFGQTFDGTTKEIGTVFTPEVKVGDEIPGIGKITGKTKTDFVIENQAGEKNNLPLNYFDEVRYYDSEFKTNKTNAVDVWQTLMNEYDKRANFDPREQTQTAIESAVDNIVEPTIPENINPLDANEIIKVRQSVIGAKQTMEKAFEGTDYDFSTLAEQPMDEQRTFLQEALNDKELTPGQRTAVANYVHTASIDKQLTQARQNIINEQLQQHETTLRSQANETTGTLVTARLKGNESSDPVIINKGLNLTQAEDGSWQIDEAGSEETIYYTDAEGKIYPTTAKDLELISNTNIDEALSELQQYYADQENAINQAVISPLNTPKSPEGDSPYLPAAGKNPPQGDLMPPKSPIGDLNTPIYKEGETAQVNTGGIEQSAKILRANEDGTYNVEVTQTIDGETSTDIDSNVAASDLEGYGFKPAVSSEQLAVSQEQQTPQYPTKKDGSIDFDAMDDVQTINYMRDAFGDKEAERAIFETEQNIKLKIVRTLKEIENFDKDKYKQQKKAETLQERAKILAEQKTQSDKLNEKLTGLQKRLDAISALKTTNVEETPTPQEESTQNTQGDVKNQEPSVKSQVPSTKSQKETPVAVEPQQTVSTEGTIDVRPKEKASKQTPMQKRLNSLGDYLSVEDYVLRAIAGGLKFKWNDATGTKGLGAEFRYSDNERKMRFNIIDEQNGITPEQFAHNIWELPENEIPGLHGLDTQDILNVIHDITRMHTSTRQMIESAEAMRNTEQMYGVSEEELNAFTQSEIDAIPDEIPDELFFEVVNIANFTPEQQTELHNLINQAYEFEQSNPGNETGSKTPNSVEPTQGTVADGENQPVVSSQQSAEQSPKGFRYLTEEEAKKIYHHTGEKALANDLYSNFDDVSRAQHRYEEYGLKKNITIQGREVEATLWYDGRNADQPRLSYQYTDNNGNVVKQTLLLSGKKILNGGGFQFNKVNVKTEVLENKVKQPWEMTAREQYDLGRKEFIKTAGKAYVQKHMATFEEYVRTHKQIIQQAISEGKQVPENVLAEYPDLQPNPKPQTPNNVSPTYKNGDEIDIKGEKYTVNGVGTVYGTNDVIYTLEKDGKPIYEDVTEEEIKQLQENKKKEAGIASNVELPDKSVELIQKSDANTPNTKINDFGEKIEGAKKYLATKNTSSKEDIASLPLSKSFPQPDFKTLVENGTFTEDEAVALKYLYDNIPVKPRSKYKLSSWVQKVQNRIDLFNECLSDKTKSEQIIKALRTSVQFKDYATYEATLKAMGFPKEQVNLGTYYIKQFTGRNDYSILNGNYIIKDYKTLEEAVNGLRQILNANKQALSEKSGTKFELYQDRTTKKYFIGKKTSVKVIRLIDNIETLSEARKILSEQKDQVQAIWDGLKVDIYERREINNPRVGTDYRNGKDVTPEDFNKFGFRGVQFGNWVNQSERQQSLNEAYDALMDLSTALNISPSAVSLNGELGLAFGARGSGGKISPSAHYEPQQIVINLTKLKGAGSLAHEWWHALDNYFSRMRGEKLGYVTDNPKQKMLPYSEQTQNEIYDQRVRKEVLDAYKEVLNSIKQTELVKRSEQLDQTRSKLYWSTPVEMTARSFENYIIEKLGASSERNDYLANFKTITEWVDAGGLDMNTYPYPNSEETPQINKAYENLFNTIQEKVDQETGNTILFDASNTPKQQSDLALIHQVIDQLKKKGLARNVIIDEKAMQDYLSKHGFEDLRQLAYWLNNSRQRDRWDNSGYTEREDGTKVSVRALEAESEGTFTSGQFRKVYGVSKTDFDILVDLGIIRQTEWHHTGKSFKESDFYTWADGTRADGEVDYTHENGNWQSEETQNSLAQKYADNKKAINKLSKEFTGKKWEYKKIINPVEPYQTLEDYIFYNKKWAESEGRTLNDLEEDYFKKFGQQIERNKELEKINPELHKYNKNSEGKEKILSDLVDLFGITDFKGVSIGERITPYEKISKLSISKQQEEQELAQKADKEVHNKTVRERIAQKEKELSQWVEDNIANGKITQHTRVSKEPSNFITTNTEMNGKYGWFEATSRYNLPKYYSGLEFSSKELLDEYYAKKRKIGNIASEIRYFSVFHGSPHAFDKFSLDKIGTGEGLQAYGYGLYFTDKKSIAESYAKLASKGNNLKINGKTLYEFIRDNEFNDYYYRYLSTEYALNKVKFVKDAKNAYLSATPVQRDEVYNQSKKIVELLENADIEGFSQQNLYTVKIHGDKSIEDLNFLRWDKPIYEEQWLSINKLLENEYPNLYETINNNKKSFNNGQLLYEELSKFVGFEGQKSASEFLLRAGIDGIKYPTEYTTKGQHENSFNYVVFDDSKIEIEEHIRFFATKNGEVYGFATPEGDIYLDPAKLNLETPIHEFGHFLWDVMPAETKQELIDLFKQTKTWKELESEPAYSNLTTDDAKADELFQRVNGKRGAEQAKELLDMAEGKTTLWDKLKKAIAKFWQKVKEMFTPKFPKGDLNSQDRINEISDMTLRELFNGEKITPKSPEGDLNSKFKQNTDIEFANSKDYDFDVQGITKANADEMKAIKAKAQSDGTFMQAPNGKQSNLTERQWLQVRTKAFKQWFGDWEKNPENASKVVDANGEPLVVYHGTNADFNEFSKYKTDEPTYWFTQDIERASKYGNLIPVYIKSENPKFTDVIPNMPSTWNGGDSYISYVENNPILSKLARNNIEKKGGNPDDIISKMPKKGDIFSLVVSNPAQIKSATTNNDNFDEGSNDIRFSIIGEQGAEALDKAEEATHRMDNLRVAKEMESGKRNINSKNSKVAFDELVKSERTALENLIANWGDTNIELIVDEYWGDSRLKGQLGRDSWFTKGKGERSTYTAKKSDFIEWLMSEDPFNAKTWTQDEEWIDNVNAARKIVETIIPIKKSSPKEIRLATGWEKGVDGLWRYEIPDAQTTKRFNDLKAGETIKLSETIEDTELFKAYPQLKDVNVKISDTKTEAGSWNNSTNTIELSDYIPSKTTEFDEKGINEAYKSVLIHEIQHAIQEIEGFAKGGNTENQYSDKELSRQINLVESIIKQAQQKMNKDKSENEWLYSDVKLQDYISDFEYKIPKEDRETVIEWANNLAKAPEQDIEEFLRETPKQRYNRLAGEVEARNASTRMNMSEDEKRNTLLAETADVAPEDQIIIMDGLGVSNSISNNEKPKYKPGQSVFDYAKEIEQWSNENKSQEPRAKSQEEINLGNAINTIEGYNTSIADLENKGTLTEQEQRRLDYMKLMRDNMLKNIKANADKVAEETIKQISLEDIKITDDISNISPEEMQLHFGKAYTLAEMQAQQNEYVKAIKYQKAMEIKQSKYLAEAGKDIPETDEYGTELAPEETEEMTNKINQIIADIENIDKSDFAPEEQTIIPTDLTSVLKDIERLKKNKSKQEKETNNIPKIKQAASDITDYIRTYIGKDVVDMMSERDFKALINRVETATSTGSLNYAMRAVNQVVQRIILRKNNDIISGLVHGKIVNTYALYELGANVGAMDAIDDEAKGTLDTRVNRLLSGINSYNRFFEIQGKSKKGVNIAKNVDEGTRQVLQFMRDNYKTSREMLNEFVNNINEETTAENYVYKEGDARKLIAIEFLNRLSDIRDQEANIKALRDQDTFEFNQEHPDTWKWQEILKEQKTLEKMQMNFIQQLTDMYETGTSKLAEWKQAEINRANEIADEANAAVTYKKIPTQKELKDNPVKKKGLLKTWWEAPLNSFEFMLSNIDKNHPTGEGKMYRRFMDLAVKASDKAYNGYNKFVSDVKNAAETITGMKFKDFVADTRKDSGMTLTYVLNPNEEADHTLEEIPMTKGELMYVWLTYQHSPDKLDKMGLSEKDINAIAEKLGDKYIEFGKWVQDYLNQTRERYNLTHVDMFGTSMGKVKNYFPLKYAKDSLTPKADVDGIDYALPSTTEGAIISRVKTDKPIKLDENFLDTLMEHADKMESWNAYAKLRKDLNGLLKNTEFRNHLEANSPGSFKDFQAAARIAVDAYQDNTTDLEQRFMNVNRRLQGAAIAGRINTALKQSTAAVAYIFYSGSPTYYGELAKNIGNAVNLKQSIDWAKKNLPTFAERLSLGNFGNEKLLTEKWEDSLKASGSGKKLGKQRKAIRDTVDAITEKGMLPNKWIDGVIFAGGSHAIYEYEKKKYIRSGMTSEEAENRALFDASNFSNKVSQSSNPAYLSPLQKSQTVWAQLLSTFMNANFALGRMSHESVAQIVKAGRQVNALFEENKKSGMNDEEARQDAQKRVLNANGRAVLHFIYATFIANIMFRMFDSVLWGSGDDDKKKKKLIDAAWQSPLNNTVGSDYAIYLTQIASNLLFQTKEKIYNPRNLFESELDKSAKNLMSAAKEGFSPELAEQTINTAIKFGYGLNLETLTNMYDGFDKGIKKNGGTEMAFQYFANVPQSARIETAKKYRKGETIFDYAKRVELAYSDEKRFEKELSDIISNYITKSGKGFEYENLPTTTKTAIKKRVKDELGIEPEKKEKEEIPVMNDAEKQNVRNFFEEIKPNK